MNATQKAVCSIMRQASFNNFDADKVIKDLESNEDKWLGFIFGRWGYLELVPLRDILSNHYNADTLWIAVKDEYLRWIIDSAIEWKADEIDVIRNGKAYDTNGFLIEEADDDEISSRLGISDVKDINFVRIWFD